MRIPPFISYRYKLGTFACLYQASSLLRQCYFGYGQHADAHAAYLLSSLALRKPHGPNRVCLHCRFVEQRGSAEEDKFWIEILSWEPRAFL